MNLYEYQAKELFKSFNIPVPNGKVANSVIETINITKEFPDSKVVIKAQVHTGGRGKAGGIKLANSLKEVEEKSKNILGMDIKGYKVKRLLIEEQMDISKEMYLSFVQDRDNKCYKLIFSTEGGMDIEELAKTKPEKIFMKNINPYPGLSDYQIRETIFTLDDELKDYRKGLFSIIKKLYKLFINTDSTLIEINPLVITKDGDFFACDGKVNLDDNGLYRNKELLKYRIPSDENPLEKEAKDKRLSYVKLDGNIGCMVNGAGLAMATMDVVKYYGGKPANFLDIGGGAKAQQVKDALEIILRDSDVNTIFVNIFGGIVRCDLVAQGIVKAKEELNINIPMVIRLIGTNDKEAYKLLKEKNISVYTTMDEASKEAVKFSKN